MPTFQPTLSKAEVVASSPRMSRIALNVFPLGSPLLVWHHSRKHRSSDFPALEYQDALELIMTLFFNYLGVTPIPD